MKGGGLAAPHCNLYCNIGPDFRYTVRPSRVARVRPDTYGTVTGGSASGCNMLWDTRLLARAFQTVDPVVEGSSPIESGGDGRGVSGLIAPAAIGPSAGKPSSTC